MLSQFVWIYKDTLTDRNYSKIDSIRTTNTNNCKIIFRLPTNFIKTSTDLTDEDEEVSEFTWQTNRFPPTRAVRSRRKNSPGNKVKRRDVGRSRCDGDGDGDGDSDGNLQAPKLTVMKIGYQSKRHPADRTVLPALERVISHWGRTDGEHGTGIRVHGKRITLTQSGRNPFIFSPGTLRPRVTLRVIRGRPCPSSTSPPATLSNRRLRRTICISRRVVLVMLPRCTIILHLGESPISINSASARERVSTMDFRRILTLVFAIARRTGWMIWAARRNLTTRYISILDRCAETFFSSTRDTL